MLTPKSPRPTSPTHQPHPPATPTSYRNPLIESHLARAPEKYSFFPSRFN